MHSAVYDSFAGFTVQELDEDSHVFSWIWASLRNLDALVNVK